MKITNFASNDNYGDRPRSDYGILWITMYVNEKCALWSESYEQIILLKLRGGRAGNALAPSIYKGRVSIHSTSHFVMKRV